MQHISAFLSSALFASNIILLDCPITVEVVYDLKNECRDKAHEYLLSVYEHNQLGSGITRHRSSESSLLKTNFRSPKMVLDSSHFHSWGVATGTLPATLYSGS